MFIDTLFKTWDQQTCSFIMQKNKKKIVNLTCITKGGNNLKHQSVIETLFVYLSYLF